MLEAGKFFRGQPGDRSRQNGRRGSLPTPRALHYLVGLSTVVLAAGASRSQGARDVHGAADGVVGSSHGSKHGMPAGRERCQSGEETERPTRRRVGR
jgi:hypothetical protein